MATKKPRSSSKSAKTVPAAEIAELKHENQRLKAKLAEASKGAHTSVRQHRSFWRSAFALLFATVAVIAIALFNIAYWSNTTITNTDQFVSTMQPLIKDPNIQKAIQTEVTSKLFSQIDLEGELKTALPENVQFIAQPLASQVQSFTYTKIGEVLNSDKAEQVWTKTLYTGHSQIMAFIQNPKNDGKVTINDIYALTSAQLKNSDVGFLFNKQLPSSVGTITLANVEGIPKVRLALNKLRNLTDALLVVSIVSVILAIAMSYKRRNMIIGISVGTFVVMIITNQIYILLRHAIANHTLPEYSAAATSIVTIITKPLIEQTRGAAALIASAILIAIITSKWPTIVKARRGARHLLDIIFGKLVGSWKGISFFDRVAKNSTVISWTLIGVGFAAFAFRLPPSMSGVADALIFSAVAVLATEIIASIARTTQKN